MQPPSATSFSQMTTLFSLEQMCMLVDKLEQSLGQKINFKKFELFFSLNCTQQRKRWFSGILRVKCTSKPSKYQGIEIGSMNQKKNFFQPLLDKFNKKLAGWKTQFLSQEGMLTLIKSTLASIPIYTLSCFKAPFYICKKIDQMIKGFQWGHDPRAKKLHLSNRNDICSEKTHGGLGIRKIEVMNRAFLGKQAWRILTDQTTTMTTTLLPKYYGKKPFSKV